MLQVIIQNITQYFYAYVNHGSKIAVVVFLLVFIAKIYKESVFRSLKDAICSALLGMYIYIVIGITMLSRMEEYVSYINLDFFSTFNNSFSSKMYIYENILLFVPLTILLFTLTKAFRKWWVALITGILCSIIIETIQLMAHLGRFEVDDILTNTLGALLGFLLCKILELIYRRQS